MQSSLAAEHLLQPVGFLSQRFFRDRQRLHVGATGIVQVACQRGFREEAGTQPIETHRGICPVSLGPFEWRQDVSCRLQSGAETHLDAHSAPLCEIRPVRSEHARVLGESFADAIRPGQP